MVVPCGASIAPCRRAARAHRATGSGRAHRGTQRTRPSPLSGMPQGGGLVGLAHCPPFCTNPRTNSSALDSEHTVDLVEDRVDVVAHRLTPSGSSRRSRQGVARPGRPRAWSVGSAPGSTYLLLTGRGRCTRRGSSPTRHALLLTLPSRSDLRGSRRQTGEQLGDPAAVSTSAPTCSLVPRRGSSIGTRRSTGSPGTSKTTESHDAATTCCPNRSRHRPRKYAGCPPAGSSPRRDVGLRTSSWTRPIARSRWASPLLGRTSANCRSTAASRASPQPPSRSR